MLMIIPKQKWEEIDRNDFLFIFMYLFFLQWMFFFLEWMF